MFQLFVCNFNGFDIVCALNFHQKPFKTNLYNNNNRARTQNVFICMKTIWFRVFEVIPEARNECILSNIIKVQYNSIIFNSIPTFLYKSVSNAENNLTEFV